jgi:hypothetical protein
MNDRRIWYPDETCSPWSWETAINLAATGVVGQIRTPTNHTVLIKEALVTTTTAGVTAKNTCRFILSTDPANSPNPFPVSIHGAIQDLSELGTDGLNYPGFVVTANSGPRKVTILLKGGMLYQIFQIGTSGGIVSLNFNGWAFPDKS